jgi:hypothetical protein|tara:strand:- start:66 stop:293 length:228 start_codon:yes stop_codon:yes gene_type:complete
MPELQSVGALIIHEDGEGKNIKQLVCMQTSINGESVVIHSDFDEYKVGHIVKNTIKPFAFFVGELTMYAELNNEN